MKVNSLNIKMINIFRRWNGFEEEPLPDLIEFRLSLIKKEKAAIEPTDLCLSDDVLNFFIAMLLYCMTGITDDDLAAIRQLTTEKYLGIQRS